MSSSNPPVRTAASILASNSKPWTRAVQSKPAQPASDAKEATPTKDNKASAGRATKPARPAQAQATKAAPVKPAPKLPSNSMWVKPPSVASSATDASPIVNDAASDSSAPSDSNGVGGQVTASSSMSWRSASSTDGRPNLKVGRVTGGSTKGNTLSAEKAVSSLESGPPSARSVSSNHSHQSTASSKSKRADKPSGQETRRRQPAQQQQQPDSQQQTQKPSAETPREVAEDKQSSEAAAAAAQPKGQPTDVVEEKERDEGHRLETPWTLYFDKKLKQQTDFKQFEQNLKKLGTFTTMEELYKAYSYMQSPDDLPDNVDVFMFRHNYIPAWETFPNGGCWIIKVLKKNGLINRMWEELVFACASEQFEEPNIAGIMLGTRHKEDVLSVWNRDNLQYPDLRFNIGQKLKDLLNLDDSTVVEYKSFTQSLQDGSTFRGSTQYTYAAQAKAEEENRTATEQQA